MMRLIQQQSHLKKLEQFPLQIRKLVRVRLRSLWQTILENLHSSSREPRVWQKRDRFGNQYWRVYDPASDRTLHFNNKQKVTIWLDERHYDTGQSNFWDIS